MTRRVKKFLVGDVEDGADFTKEYITALEYRIAVWFADKKSGYNYDEPTEEARGKVRQALLGVNSKGEEWKGASDSFAKRIRAMCNYDIESDKGIPNKRNSKETARGKRDAAAKDAAEELAETNTVATEFDHVSYRAKLEKDIYAEFPELDNSSARPHVESYSLLMSQRKVIDAELTLSPKSKKRDALLQSLKTVNEQSVAQMKMLGIHPDQIRSAVKSKSSSTVSELVAQMESDDNFKEREKIWALQLALQLYWMSEHYNGRKTGPQISTFQCWHMTRSRPINHKCACGRETTLVEGFEPNELRDWLLKEGVLVEEPVLPKLFSAADLAGLATADLTPHP